MSIHHKVTRVSLILANGINYLSREGVFPFIKKIQQRFWGYRQWIDYNEPKPDQLEQQRILAAELVSPIVFSIILPVFETPVNVLRETIVSVINQTYPHWQLCISNGSPNNLAICSLLLKYSDLDKRIQVKNLPENLGIAGNTNAAISLATGQYIAFLDHDDTLSPFALFEVNRAILRYPFAEIIYSDEDLLTANGKKRYGEYFKSAFSLEFLRSNNYMCHFLVIKKSTGDSIQWLRQGYDGAQDFDLILRAVEKSTQVVHIPKILYHWRALPTSTASGVDAKGYAEEAGLKALQSHLDRLGVHAIAEGAVLRTNYRVQYNLDRNPSVAILIPNNEHADDLNRCVRSIISNTGYENYKIYILENNSKDKETFNLYKELTSDPHVSLIEFHDDFNYSRIHNYSSQELKEDYLLFLNNDTRVDKSDWLHEMLQLAEQPMVGIVGAKLLFPDGTIQHGGVFVPSADLVPGHSHKESPATSAGYHGRLLMAQDLSAVTAACMLINRRVYEEVAGFDEKFVIAFGDIDLCLKVRAAGYRIIWTPFAEIIHYESKTRGYEDTPEKNRRYAQELGYFREKWRQTILNGDPFYNPNLIASGRFNCLINPYPSNQSPRCLSTQIDDIRKKTN